MSATIGDILAARTRYEKLRSKCKTALQRSAFNEEMHELPVEWEIKVTQVYRGGSGHDPSITGVVVRQGWRSLVRNFEASASLPGCRDRLVKVNPGDIIRVSGTVDMRSVQEASCHIVDGSLISG